MEWLIQNSGDLTQPSKAGGKGKGGKLSKQRRCPWLYAAGMVSGRLAADEAPVRMQNIILTGGQSRRRCPEQCFAAPWPAWP
eukprot:365192-Chlamydomonas_euryale.AAC.17